VTDLSYYPSITDHNEHHQHVVYTSTERAVNAQLNLKPLNTKTNPKPKPLT